MPTEPLKPVSTTNTIIPSSPKPQQSKLVAQKSATTQIQTPQKKATLLKQVRDARFGPNYAPLQIRFLTGIFQDELLDLGFNIQKMSSSQSADWEKQKGQSTRVGHNFVNISPREYSLTLDYWSLNDDIQQLVELNAHLQELTTSPIPPKVQFVFGVATVQPLICTKFSFEYDSPLPNGGGMRHGSVQLTFELSAGKGTEHANAKALAPTALRDKVDQQNKFELERKGIVGRTRNLLAECLTTDQNNNIANLIEKNKLGDTEALLKLSAPEFIQLAVAGSIDTKVLAQPQIQEKLKNDLASEFASKEPGITPLTKIQLQKAILSGDPSALPSSFNTPLNTSTTDASGASHTVTQTLFEQITADYQEISSAISDQKLGSDSKVFDPNNTSTSDRLLKIARCGLNLRNAGAPTVAPVNGKDAVLLAGINNAISSAKTDEDLKKIFNLRSNTPETVIRKLRNSSPYKSKEQFLQDSSYNQLGVTGYSLWSSFDQQETATLTNVNSFLHKDNLSDDDIKKAFNAGDDQLKALKGKTFASKEDFLKVFSSDSNFLNGKGNDAWQTFKANH